MVDTLLSAILSLLALLSNIVEDKIVWPEGPGGGGSDLSTSPIIIEYVWSEIEQTYILANDGVENETLAAAVKMYIGPIDPTVKGLTVRPGDHWLLVAAEVEAS